MSSNNGTEAKSTGPAVECPSNRLRRRSKYPSCSVPEILASDLDLVPARKVKAFSALLDPFRPPESDEASEQVTALKLKELRCALLIG